MSMRRILAIFSVCTFAYIIIDEIAEKIAFDESKAIVREKKVEIDHQIICR